MQSQQEGKTQEPEEALVAPREGPNLKSERVQEPRESVEAGPAPGTPDHEVESSTQGKEEDHAGI
jgi:hypothetical protein